MLLLFSQRLSHFPLLPCIFFSFAPSQLSPSICRVRSVSFTQSTNEKVDRASDRYHDYIVGYMWKLCVARITYMWKNCRSSAFSNSLQALWYSTKKWSCACVCVCVWHWYSIRFDSFVHGYIDCHKTRLPHPHMRAITLAFVLLRVYIDLWTGQ